MAENLTRPMSTQTPIGVENLMLYPVRGKVEVFKNRGLTSPLFYFSFFVRLSYEIYFLSNFQAKILHNVYSFFRTSQSQILMRVKFRAGANSRPCQIFNELELNELQVLDSWDEGRSWDRLNYKKSLGAGTD